MVAFIATMVSTGVVLPDDSNSDTGTTLIQRPRLPGDDSTDSTLGGVSVRCKDGTYSFVAGDDKSDDDLCKDNGGVDQRL